MKRLSKKGVSLAEVLAVTVIGGIIAGMIGLFLTQSVKSIASHRENANMIQEVAFVFREFEKQLEGKNKVIVKDSTNTISVESNSITLMTIFKNTNSVMIDNNLFPSASNVVFTDVSFSKSPVEETNPNLDLYDFKITVTTTDSESAKITKDFKTSFLIPIK